MDYTYNSVFRPETLSVSYIQLVKLISKYYYYYFDACEDVFVSIGWYVFKIQMTY